MPVLDPGSIEAERGLRLGAYIMDIEGGEAEFIAAEERRLARARFVLLELHADLIGAEACEGVRHRLSAAGLVRRGRVLNAEAWLRP